MRRVAGCEAFGGGKMSDRQAVGISCDWLGCAWVDMEVGVWGCKMSDIWDASGLLPDKLGVALWDSFSSVEMSDISYLLNYGRW